MKVAIASEGTDVFQHFGHCKSFTIFDIEDERIINKAILDTSKSGHEALVNVLYENGVDVLICGGIGGGAKSALREKRIEIIPGVTGEVDSVLIKYLSGQELGNSDFECSEHHHEGENHTCHCTE